MGDTCGVPPPRLPPTHFSSIANSARDLISRGFVGGQVLSVSCSGPCGTKLTSTATIAHASSIGSMSATLVEGQRKHDLAFSTLNNQISGTTIFLNVWCPGMAVAVSTSIKEGASDGAINWTGCGYRGADTTAYFTRSINSQTQVSAHVSYLRGNSRPSELEGRMCGIHKHW